MKKNLSIIILILLLMPTPLSHLFSQEGRGKGRLVGYVVDKDKNPVAGVSITLEYFVHKRKLVTTSNKKGKWSFLGVGRGDVKISAEKDGYTKSVIQLSVSGVKKNPIHSITLVKISEPEVVPNYKGGELKNKLGQAQALFEKQKFKDALKLYQEFLELMPDSCKIRSNIAQCYLELGQYDKALDEFQWVLNKTLSLDTTQTGTPEVAKIYASIGDVYMRQDKFKEAEIYFKKSIDIDKSNPALAYNVAEILFVADKVDEAIDFYKMSIQIDPNYIKAYKKLGYAYLNRGKTDKAIEVMKKFLELVPDSPDAQEVKEVLKAIQQ